MDKDITQGRFDGLSRRRFLAMLGAAGATLAAYKIGAKRASAAESIEPVSVQDVQQGEDIFAYIKRMKGGFDQRFFQQVIGAANEFKEGDLTIGVGAKDDAARHNARALLSSTKIKDLYEHPLLVDSLQKLIWQTTDQARYAEIKEWTMGRLKEFLLTQPEVEIKAIMAGLTSDTIGCVPKLMTNEELIKLSQKIFNVLPGAKIGAKGYMGARIQPNSPTDHPDDVAWQVFDAFSYATGDIVIGTNPVDSQVKNNLAVQKTLREIVEAFQLQDTIPWCVLAHIDVQAEVRKQYPGMVETMFQSIAGTDDPRPPGARCPRDARARDPG